MTDLQITLAVGFYLGAGLVAFVGRFAAERDLHDCMINAILWPVQTAWAFYAGCVNRRNRRKLETLKPFNDAEVLVAMKENKAYLEKEIPRREAMLNPERVTSHESRGTKHAD